MSVSGLSSRHVKAAVDGVLQAAILGYKRREYIGYTQSVARWEGIDRRRNASLGQFPRWADCSAFATWCYWNGLYLRGGHTDIVNGEHWEGGYTGTMMEHGQRVLRSSPAMP